MTMVAINTRPDGVTVMRDGIAYTPDGSTIVVASAPVVHLEASHALTTWRGDDTLGRLWGRVSSSSEVASLDELLERAPTVLMGIVAFVHSAADVDRGPTGEANVVHIYLSGWSVTEGRFVSRILRSDNSFTPEPIEAMHVAPAPTGATWSQVESRHWEELADVFAAAGVDQPAVEPGTPEPSPADPAAWADLARRIHDTRGCADPSTGLKVPVGGTVTLTTLTSQAVERRDLFTFSADDHARMLAGTFAAEPDGHDEAPTATRDRELVSVGEGKPAHG